MRTGDKQLADDEASQPVQLAELDAQRAAKSIEDVLQSVPLTRSLSLRTRDNLLAILNIAPLRSSGNLKPEAHGIFSPTTRVAICTVLTVTITLLLIGACWPHMAGRPRIYAMLFGCSEPEAFAERYDTELEIAVTNAVRRSMRDLEQRHPFQPIRRGQHARTTACLQANFAVRSFVRRSRRPDFFSWNPGEVPLALPLFLAAPAATLPCYPLFDSNY